MLFISKLKEFYKYFNSSEYLCTLPIAHTSGMVARSARGKVSFPSEQPVVAHERQLL